MDIRTNNPSGYITVSDAAARLRMSKTFVLDQLRQGKLVGRKFGRTWRIALDDLAAYEEQSKYVVPVPKYRHRKIVRYIAD
jgi:excisionase family DNA binding protein